MVATKMSANKNGRRVKCEAASPKVVELQQRPGFQGAFSNYTRNPPSVDRIWGIYIY